MAHESDEILRRYIEKIVRLQREREQEEISENDLRQIAVEAGMSDADLAYAEKRTLEYLDRGSGFIRYGNWDRAITELDQAAALAPANTTVLNALATAHWNRFLLRATEEDRDTAARYAERTLRIDPRNDPALRLLSTIHRGGEEAPTPVVPGVHMARKRSTVGIALGVAIAALGAGIALWLIAAPSGEPAPPPAIEESAPPQAMTPPAPPAPPAEAPADTGFARLVATFGNEGIGPGLFRDGRSIAADGAGNIYVGEYSNGRVQMFDSAGSFITQWNIGEKRYIKAMAADRAGTVYIAHSNGLYRYEGSSGAELGKVKFGSRGSGCTDVVATADGGLITSWDGNSRSGIMIDPEGKDDIVRFDKNGKVVRTIVSAISKAADEFEFNVRVAEDGLGTIYALGSIHRAVFKFSPEGRFITRFGGGESGKFSSPDAIAVDGKGRVYVADFGGVLVFDSEGGYLGTIDIRGVASGLVFNPRGELLVVARTKVYRYAIRK